MRLTEKYRTQKIANCAALHNFVRLYLRNNRLQSADRICRYCAGLENQCTPINKNLATAETAHCGAARAEHFQHRNSGAGMQSPFPSGDPDPI